jgi:epidermal growth factor receptor substrate 15
VLIFTQGDNARSIFEKAALPNDVLSRIWHLADTEQRGALSSTEFIIAMHLLTSLKSGTLKALPANIPAALYEAASRRGPTGRGGPVPSAIPRQFHNAGPQGRSSPIARGLPYGTPPQSAQTTGTDWLVTPEEKAASDAQFNKVDQEGHGYINGEQARLLLINSGLPEDTLAAIWDLADTNATGFLTPDTFAVAYYLTRQVRKSDYKLPHTLPPNLIPPSMRNQPRPRQQPAPVSFQIPPEAPQPPKPASADLFDLGDFSTPAPTQVQLSTGGSGSYSKTFEDPFGSKSASPTSPSGFASRTAPQSTFKPFIPQSTFGQNLTGGSGSSQPSTRSPLGPSKSPSAQQSSAIDDLLVDHDPEVSKKLTQDTTELANMSNQISILRTQMQEVQNKKTTTNKDLGSASTQKRDMELRLSQFRTQYEQEVKIVKQLEDRLIASRSETQKLRQDLAMIEGTYQDLQNNYRQQLAAYEANQRENDALKERIRQLNNEISQLRPQLEKLKTDARQPKGLVSINKKQLSTLEGERDKIKNEMNELQRSAQEPSRSPYQADTVASPAASTTSQQSTNPFFRRSPPATVSNVMSPGEFGSTSNVSQSRDFDNLFGPSSTNTMGSNAPPATSFRSENQYGGFSHQTDSSVRSSEPGIPTPSASPPASSYHESPRAADLPAPPEARQFASNLLPMREPNVRSDSFSSSVKVSAPGSRYEGGAETPTAGTSSPIPSSTHDRQISRDTTDAPGMLSSSTYEQRNRAASPATSATSEGLGRGQGGDESKDAFSSFGMASAHRDIPGAFPQDITNNPVQQEPTGGSEQSKGTSRDDPFAPKDPKKARSDFDSAFASIGQGRQYQERQDTGSSLNGSVGSVPTANKFNKEFPPIEQLEDSDTNSEPGFEDDFTSASPQRQSTGKQPAGASSRPTTGGASTISDNPSLDAYTRSRPPVGHTESSASLPGPNAQKSPPTYEQTVGPPKHGSNQFPPEFGGLLPSREDPTSPPVAQSPEKSFASPANTQGQAPFNTTGASKAAFAGSPPPTDTPSSTVPSDAYHSAVSHPTSATEKGPSPANPSTQPRPTFDDFDTGFDDLAEAREANDKDDDDFMLSSQGREGLDEFNPVFDSPAASKSNTLASQQTPTGKAHGDESFGDFDQMSQSFAAGGKQSQQPTSSSHDWDAIFSGLESSQAKDTKAGFGDASNKGPAPFSSFNDRKEESSKQSGLPPLNRALSASSEHDDPLVQQLVSEGFPRSKVVPALENYDYNTDKVRNY